MTRQAFIRTRSEQLVEARFGRPVGQVLDELYRVRGLSQRQIADELGVHRTTVVEWMSRHGVASGYNRTKEPEA